MQSVPAAPKVTYPHGPLKSLHTVVGWMGDDHDRHQVRITYQDDPNAAAVYDSGIMMKPAWSHTPPQLPSETSLFAFVRLHNSAGWGPWSAGQAFSTPPVPVIRILSPENAGRVRGPDVEIKWECEFEEAITDLKVVFDGKELGGVTIKDRRLTVSNVSPGVHSVTVKAADENTTAEQTAGFYVYIPPQAAGGMLYTLDLKALRKTDVGDPRAAAAAFDTLHAMAVLQGIVNRSKAQLYIDFTDADAFWLDLLRQKGGWLQRVSLARLKGPEDAITTFRKHIRGAVVWDPQVPCTSNIATTICGVEGLIPVRYDPSPGSLYNRLIKSGPKLKIVHDLRGKFTGKGKIADIQRQSTGSAKCDAYLWAKAKYIDSGKCTPTELGYWCDAFWLRHPKDMALSDVGLSNHDYIVARRGFVFDLNVWKDEAPRDDPRQKPGTDRETLREILLSCHRKSGGRMIHISGFTPWAVKYTSFGKAGGKHEPVLTEWETVRLVSAYNGFLDADAIGYVAMANASVFSHYPLPDRLVQNPPPTREDLESKGYIDADGNVAKLNFLYHYLGDYDSAAWMYNRLPEIWRSPVRGQIPAGWAFNPNLIERMSPAFDWCYQTKSPADFFIAGDNGAGYVNPTQLLPPRDPSGLPSGAQAWVEHCKPYYRRLGYSITGFIINGLAGELTDESNAIYGSFSGDGMMTQLHWMPKDKKSDHLLGSMPVAGMQRDITGAVDDVVKQVVERGSPGETKFLSFRSILVGPEWIKAVNEEIRKARPDCRFEPVDPYTYFYLLRHTLGGKNERRASYTFDTMPNELNAGQDIRISVGVRNDGWETWSREGDQAVHLHAGFSGRQGGLRIALPEDVRPGHGTVISFSMKAPSEVGKHTFTLEMVRGKDGYFGDAGDMAFEKNVVVRSATPAKKKRVERLTLGPAEGGGIMSWVGN